MSSSRRTLIPCLALFLGACVSASDRFDEFDQRVRDAAASSVEGCDGDALPDISGQYYLALSPVIAPSSLLQFTVDSEMTAGDDGTATVDFSFQPLCVREGEGAQDCGDQLLQPVGDPLPATGVTVASDCTFRAELLQAVVPGKANPISGSDIRGDIIVVGSIRTTELYCGDVEGMLQEPIPLSLEGSTFAAQRIEPGTTGAALPDPLAACPAQTPDGDAGVPDAGPADAGAGDAGPEDAAPEDGGGAA